MKICSTFLTILSTVFLPQDVWSSTTWVPEDESITLSCKWKYDIEVKPIWKFSGKIIYADKFLPKDIEMLNVHGETTNSSISYLHIQRFEAKNVGNYTCFVNRTLWNVSYLNIFEIPRLLIQENGETITDFYQVKKDKELTLTCLAMNSLPGVTLNWTFDQTGLTAASYGSQYQSTTQTVNAKINLTASQDVTITCHLNYGLFWNLRNLSVAVFVLTPTIQTSPPTMSFVSDKQYIIISGGILVTLIIAVLMTAICMKRKKESRSREKSDLSTARGSNGSLDMTLHNANQDIDVNISDWETSSDGMLQDDIELISLLSSGNIFDYWKASSKSSSSNEFFVAKSVSDKAQMKDGYNFIAIANNIRQLDRHENIVTFLGCSIETVPYFIYQELLENGTLRDFLLQTGQAQGVDLHGSERNEELTNMYVLVGFARDIASGVEFLHMNKFCHPVLTTEKILLDGNSSCKLFDFWPNEIVSDRLTKLFHDENPLIAWFPPETIFMNHYDSVSDIWSYGVLLWEIFSLGEIPYHHKSNKEIEDHVRRKELLPRPLSCPGAIFSIMLSTWTQSRETRPTMLDVKGKVDDLSANDLPQPDVASSSKTYLTLESNVDYAVPWTNI